MKTQVGIIGAGPSGLLLAHLLLMQGIESVVIEARTRDYIEHRQRAGLLEDGSSRLLRDIGVGARMDRDGLVHEGIVMRFDGESHRVPVTELTDGKVVTIYAQHEVVKDLVAARLAAGRDILFEVSDVSVHDFADGPPSIRFRTKDGQDEVLHCDVIAACDGFHGICRPALPEGFLTVYDKLYPFGWLGILVDVAPSCDELVYASHANGFALLTMRSPTVSRLYLQCAPDEDIDGWSDDRIWSELSTRVADRDGFVLKTGPITQKGVTAMRSFVVAPMRCGALYLVGDAAHIVPPTGAKGMNLAFADVRILADALVAKYRRGDASKLDAYSDTALRRVWKAERFSWWFTTLMHRFDGASPFERRMQVAELDYLMGSRAGMTTIAENYVGLPLVL